MGEISAIEESILGKGTERATVSIRNALLQKRRISGHLHSFPAGNLKYVHAPASGYNRCSLSAIEAVLLVDDTNGDAFA